MRELTATPPGIPGAALSAVPSDLLMSELCTRSLTVLIAEHNVAESDAIANVLAMGHSATRFHEAGSLAASFEILRKHPEVSLFVLNPELPDVIFGSSFRLIRRTFPEVRLVLFTNNCDRVAILQALDAGVHGIIPYTYGLERISAAFAHILKEQIFVPIELAWAPNTGNTFVSFLREKSALRLTTRQAQIIELIKSGKSRKEIARELLLSENTVKVHAAAAYKALGVKTRASLIMIDKTRLP